MLIRCRSRVEMLIRCISRVEMLMRCRSRVILSPVPALPSADRCYTPALTRVSSASAPSADTCYSSALTRVSSASTPSADTCYSSALTRGTSTSAPSADTCYSPALTRVSSVAAGKLQLQAPQNCQLYKIEVSANKKYAVYHEIYLKCRKSNRGNRILQ